MSMKKITSLFIGMTIVLTAAATPVLAAEKIVQQQVRVIESKAASGETLDEGNVKISKDEAKQIAKQMLKNFFSMEMDEKKFETRIELRQDYDIERTYVWGISWHMYDDEKNINIDVTIDANSGKIKSFSKHEYNHQRQESLVAVVTKEQARETAENFIKRISPEEFKQVKFMDLNYMKYSYGGYGSKNYQFRYIREVNGIPFDQNYIMVEVDGTTGKILSYRYNWDDVTDFPSPEAAIDREKAYGFFKQHANMTLQYVAYRNRYIYPDQVKEVKLVYTPMFSQGNMLDAKTGDIVDWRGTAQEEKKEKDLTEEEKKKWYQKAKTVKPLDKEIDNSRAAKVINNLIKELIGDEYKIENIRYIEGEEQWETGGRKAWSAHFVKKEGQSRYDFGGSITIDALTEELISIYRHVDRERSEDEFEPGLTWEEAYDKSLDLICEHFPGKMKDIETKQTYVQHIYISNNKRIPDRRYGFHFSRIVNGLQYRENYISIGFDAKTGEITEVRCRWDEQLEFPGTDVNISREDAEEIFFEMHSPELAYTAIPKEDEGNGPKAEIKLIYRLRSESAPFLLGNIDAFTGKFVDFRGEEVSQQQDNFKEKIQGHWAEKELSILAYQGIINTGTFEADREITLIEFIKMLVNAKGYDYHMARNAEKLKFTNDIEDDEIYRYVQLAVKYGLIENEQKELRINRNITREEMVMMLVKLLGYGKLAEISHIFVLDFEDAGEVSGDKFGYIAIANGLQIISGNNGKFRPRDNATMVEAAVTIYKALTSMKGMQ